MSERPIGCIGIGPSHHPCPRRLRCETHWVLRHGRSEDVTRVWHLCRTEEYERFVQVRYGAL